MCRTPASAHSKDVRMQGCKDVRMHPRRLCVCMSGDFSDVWCQKLSVPLLTNPLTPHDHRFFHGVAAWRRSLTSLIMGCPVQRDPCQFPSSAAGVSRQSAQQSVCSSGRRQRLWNVGVRDATAEESELRERVCRASLLNHEELKRLQNISGWIYRHIHTDTQEMFDLKCLHSSH